MRRVLSAACGIVILLVVVSPLFCFRAPADEPKLDLSPVNPLSPKEELATFRIQKGFRVELVASEPAVIDPAAANRSSSPDGTRTTRNFYFFLK